MYVADVRCLSVNAQQQIIVGWMARQMERLDWRAERWAREAGLAPTTVTRAMSDSYNSVSSVPTLHALARAAGVPSIVDFLDGQAKLVPNYPILTAILTELLPVVGCNLSEMALQALGEAVAQAISGMAEQPNTSDPELARILGRAARSALHEHLRSPSAPPESE